MNKILLQEDKKVLPFLQQDFLCGLMSRGYTSIYFIGMYDSFLHPFVSCFDKMKTPFGGLDKLP